jgi:hypothetical protein
MMSRFLTYPSLSISTYTIMLLLKARHDENGIEDDKVREDHRKMTPINQ